MNKSIFRKQSIDRVSSPEELNEYIRVASPGVWVILSAVLVLLAGLLVWMIFGTIDSSVPGAVVSKDGTALCYVKSDCTAALQTGMKVRSEEKNGILKSVSAIPVRIDETTEPYLLYVGEFRTGDFCYMAEVEIEGLPDGIYSAKITTDSIRPISFVIP